MSARYAFRTLGREKAFFIFAALIVGIGVGANTAVFSVMSPLMLRPLPFEDPEQLVWVAQRESGGLSSVTSRTSNLRDFRAMNESFEALTGYMAFFEYESYNLVGDGQPERLVELASQIEPGVTSKSDLVRILGYPSSNLEKTGIWEYVWPDARFGFVDGIVQWSESRSKYWKAPRNSSTTFKPGYRCEPSGSAIPNNQEQAFDRAPQLPNPAAR